MFVCFANTLSYKFEWAKFADESCFYVVRNQYIVNHLDKLKFINFDVTIFLISNVIEEWTLMHTLERESFEKMILKTKLTSECAIIKIIKRTSNNERNLVAMLKIFQNITFYAKRVDSNEKLLRLQKMKYQHYLKYSSRRNANDEIYIIMSFVVFETLHQWYKSRNQKKMLFYMWKIEIDLWR